MQLLFTAAYSLQELVIALTIITQECFPVFEHGLGRLLRIVERVVLLAEMILYSSKALLFISRQWRRIFFARSTGLPFHRFQPHLVGKGFFAWQYLRPLKIAFDHKNGSGVTVKVYDLATKRIKTGKLTGPFSSVTRNQLVSDILLWPDGSRGDNSSFLDTLHKLYHILVISDLKRMAGEIVDQLKGNIPDFTEFGIVPKLLRCEQFIERR